MLIAAGLATAFLTSLLVLVLLRRHRSAVEQSGGAANPTEDGQQQGDEASEPGEDQPDQFDLDPSESLLVRTLRAQVRTLEQALEQADAVTLLARLLESQDATEIADAPTRLPQVAPAAIPTAPTSPVSVPPAPTSTAPALPAPAAPSGSATPISQTPPTPVLPDLAPLIESDVVLPVPPPAEPDPQRSHRRFRRSAA